MLKVSLWIFNFFDFRVFVVVVSLVLFWLFNIIVVFVCLSLWVRVNLMFWEDLVINVVLLDKLNRVRFMCIFFLKYLIFLFVMLLII